MSAQSKLLVLWVIINRFFGNFFIPAWNILSPLHQIISVEGSTMLRPRVVWIPFNLMNSAFLPYLQTTLPIFKDVTSFIIIKRNGAYVMSALAWPWKGRGLQLLRLIGQPSRWPRWNIPLWVELWETQILLVALWHLQKIRSRVLQLHRLCKHLFSMDEVTLCCMIWIGIF
jgi:hypothetical protein